MVESSSQSKDQQMGISGVVQSPTKRFIITQREPWSLPETAVELPGPGDQPGQPPTMNLLTSILPPMIVILGSVIMYIANKANGSSSSFALIVPMILMSLGFPVANIIGFSGQKKKYEQGLVLREEKYKAALDEQRKKVFGLIQEQRHTMETEYPNIEDLAGIALNHGKRLWWRRPIDSDFLSLRLGKGISKPSFIVAPPKNINNTDPLVQLSYRVVDEFQSVTDIPLLLNLRQTGSLAIAGKDANQVYKFTRKLLLDLVIHHSPQDLQVAVLADTRGAPERWGWLKWVPHTEAANQDIKPRRLNFNGDQIDEYLKWLVEESNSRLKQDDRVTTKRKNPRTNIVIFLDDSGIARQMPEIAQLAECGHEIGIYLIFVGGQNWPRECRARLDIASEKDFLLTQTADMSAKDARVSGEYESASVELCTKVARALASLEVIGSQSIVQLPDSIRLSQVLGNNSLDIESVKQRWCQELAPRDLLRFPVGVRSGRDGLEPMILDLKPEDLGGQQAFHTVLIGTTGSGKSVFLQSMIVAAAYNYSPKILNFLLMDFKAGASELSKLKELPHVVGMVTDLSPEMAARSLIALDSEIQRRKSIFEQAGKISDIWAYNRRFPEAPLPHLVLVLDEFAKGVEILPDLQRVLQTLATQGRALGMYLLLANQKVTAAVDALLANIEWHIVLRVGSKEEMRLVDASLPRTERPGRGYIRVKEQISEFQGSRSDQNVLKATSRAVDEFKIYDILPNGELQKLYTHIDSSAQSGDGNTPKVSELDALITLMKRSEKDLEIKPAHRIYLDPLQERINLDELIAESDLRSKFIDGKWISDASVPQELIIPVGYLDKPEECLQDILSINFNDKDGHLWIVGAPGSGKAMTVTSLLLSLAQTHTPEEAQIYILEFGSGSLRQLDTLPHVGSVIRLQEKEKIQRLLNFLDSELEKRTAHDTTSIDLENMKTPPAIFVVINNYAEMRTNYPDEADRLSRYIRDGKSAGIHLVITTNRGPELSRMVSSNIARRLVLQLASRDEYMDVIGKIVPPLSFRSEGRGFWVDDGFCEFQAASDPGTAKARIKEMDKAWTGERPVKIGTIPSCIPVATLLEIQGKKKSASKSRIPVGISYETLEVISPDLLRELPTWLILGPRESGKSNFMACVAHTLMANEPAQWKISAYSLRRSLLSDLPKRVPGVEFTSTVKAVAARLQEHTKAIIEHEECDSCKYLFLLDDLGAFFEPGGEEANTALNALVAAVSARRDVFLMAAGLMDELRIQMASPAIKLFRQSHTGVVLSKDTSELDWLGAQIPLEYRRLDFPAGRGFFISKGRPVLVQTPFIGECSGKKESL